MVGRPIVVGFDGSHFSRQALTWSLSAAAAHGCGLLIARAGETAAVTPRGPDLVMVDETAKAAREATPGVDVTVAAVPGPVVPALLELMNEAEMGVVGCRGLGATAERLVGSTSVGLASNARAPLVVVRTTYYVTPGLDQGRLVVWGDGSPAASNAMDFALDEARLRAWGVTLLHVWELVPYRGEQGPDVPEEVVRRQELEAYDALTEWSAPWMEQYPDVEIHRRVVRGDPASALLRASAGAKLLVVGARRTPESSRSLSSVCDALLHRASSPVAVINLT